MPDPYSVLGVPAAATEAQIRAAYRRLAARVHPDRQPAEKQAWAADQMRRLNAARDAALARPAAPSAHTVAEWAETIARQRRRTAARRRLRALRWAGGLTVIAGAGLVWLVAQLLGRVP